MERDANWRISRTRVVEVEASMKRCLVLLGGPPGVGKSTVLECLSELLPNVALLDADDVTNTATNFSEDPAIVIQTVVASMRDRLARSDGNGILAWVFARAEMFMPVIAGLEDTVDAVEQVYLVASEANLRERLMVRGDTDKLEYAKTRLALIEKLPHRRIDTARLTPQQVAQEVLDVFEVARQEKSHRR